MQGSNSQGSRFRADGSEVNAGLNARLNVQGSTQSSFRVQGRWFKGGLKFSVDGSRVYAEGLRFTVDGSGVKAEPSNDSGAYGEGSRFKVDGSGVKIEVCIDVVMCNHY